MKEIPLTQGMVALVDDADYEVLAIHKWHISRSASGQIYAYRHSSTVHGRRSTIPMHREILGVMRRALVDHWDGNGLNNQRSNLRPASKSQNRANQIRVSSNNTSGYRGVTWNRSHQRWQAQLGKDGKNLFLGSFLDVEDAAAAYDRAAVEAHGAFARTNQPVAGL